MPAKEVLARIHDLFAEQMLARLESGEPLTAQEQQVVIKFLANNDITAAANPDNADDILIKVMEAAERSIQTHGLQ